jgi:3D (Asp-Asp-Asp) domain-containing protein
MKNSDFIILCFLWFLAMVLYLISAESNQILLKAMTEDMKVKTLSIQQEKIYTLSAEFSAYTLSADETDDTPHIGSRNLNLYKIRPLLNVKICASRDLPLDTLIDIEGIGECLILDKMNIRYKNTGNIDILMDSKLEANNFGRKPLKYNIIN